MKKPTLIAALFGIGLSAAMLIGEGVNATQPPLVAPTSLLAFSQALPGTHSSDARSFGGWTPGGQWQARP